MRVLELMEAEARLIPKDQLSRETALSIYKSKEFSLQFPSPINDDRYEIECVSKVGYIPIDSDTIVRVTPKVPIANLFGMLELAYDLQSFKFFDGIVGVESIEEVFENLASILANRVLDRVRRGLHGDYVEYNEEMSVVKGRIDMAKTVQLLAVGGAAVQCRFHEHTKDIDDNQILLGTLQIISRLNFRRPDVVSSVNSARRALAGTIELRNLHSSECVLRIYNRLNDDYAPMHGLCRFFLEHAGPGIGRGTSDLIPFVVDMPLLFEAFVAKWLEKHAPNEIKVRGHHKAVLDSNKNLHFDIDIVIEDSATSAPLAVIDTKYKRDGTPQQNDIQQVVAYAVRMGVNKAYLVYPQKLIEPMRATVGHVTVEALSVDLSENIDEGVNALLKGLIARVHLV